MLKRKPKLGEQLIYKPVGIEDDSPGEILTVIGFNEKQKSIVRVKGENGNEASFMWRGGGVGRFYTIIEKNDEICDSRSHDPNFILVDPKPTDVSFEINIDSNKQNEHLCPKCGKPKLLGDIECPYCGIIYSKLRTIPKPTSMKAPPQPTKIKASLIRKEKRFNFPTISGKTWISIAMLVFVGLLYQYSKILGCLVTIWGVIWGLIYLTKIKNPMGHYIAANSEMPSQRKSDVQVSLFRFIGENVPDLSFKIKSSSRPIDYTVNPKNQTCTCPDFVDFRNQYEYGDVQRFCKHLMKAFCRKEIFPFVPDYLKPLLVSAKERGKGAFKEQLFFFDLNHSIILLAYNEYNAWRSVYAKDIGNEYCRYGYNVDENRWSYDKSPENHREIISVISIMRNII
ncbi:MAG: hypothetical protein V1844_09755 [Pseudomonadota bacterium]